MRFQEIQRMAGRKGIPVYRQKKLDLVRSLQRAEGNIDCFGSDGVQV